MDLEEYDDESNAKTRTRNDDEEDDLEDDDLYEQAIDIVIREKKASISFIQRQLRIGYNRSSRLVEKMEKNGILGPPNSSGKRDIL